jgi:hypothetical protein
MGAGEHGWRAVPHQHNALALYHVLSGELIEKELHTIGVQTREDEPEDASGSRMHCRKEPEPFVARIKTGTGAFSDGRPDAPQDRLETEAGFVFAPRLYLLIGMLFVERFDSQF